MFKYFAKLSLTAGLNECCTMPSEWQKASLSGYFYNKGLNPIVSPKAKKILQQRMTF